MYTSSTFFGQQTPIGLFQPQGQFPSSTTATTGKAATAKPASTTVKKTSSVPSTATTVEVRSSHGSGPTSTPVKPPSTSTGKGDSTAHGGGSADRNMSVYSAASKGNASLVTQLANQGFDVNKGRSNGVTPLFIAAQRGDVDTVKALCRAKADLNRARDDGVTPLFIAAVKGHTNVVEELARQGANVSCETSDGIAPVFVAAEHGNVGLLRVLNRFNADVKTPNRDGVTPLFIAAQNGHHEAVRLILDMGADPSVSWQGRTPLDAARYRNHMDVIQLLEAASDKVYEVGETSDAPTVEAPKLTMKELQEFLESELKKIVGLDAVKNQLRDMLLAIRFYQRQKEQGFNIENERSLHMAFLGNPGTGKTTIARLVAKLCCKLGVVKSDKCVEVSRENLVAGYVGQTAMRTRQRIQEARGGVLFVDEAYRLSDKGERDYGPEAIETIMTEMTKEDGVLFLFAGYEDRMEKFFSSNPGMDRRVPYRFFFKDYSIPQLAEMLVIKAEQRGYKLDTDVDQETLEDFIAKTTTQAQREKFNGGLINLILQEAEVHLMRRLEPYIDDIEGEVLITFEQEDLKNACEVLQERRLEQELQRKRRMTKEAIEQPVSSTGSYMYYHVPAMVAPPSAMEAEPMEG